MLSMIPTTAVSTGQSLQPWAMRAELPETVRTFSRKPAPTVSMATTYPASSAPSGETWRSTRSFLPSRRGSLRVATTVPTTRATSIEALLLSLRGRLRLANRQYVFQVLVRPRDDVHRDQLAHAAGRSRAGVCGGLD